MAHHDQRVFVDKIKEKYPTYFSKQKVFEIGSLNINGTLRDFFHECEFIGCDVGEGPGVDVVCSGHEYDAPDNSFDVTCSAECFEHNPYWLESFQNMIRVTKPGGLIFFTCASTNRNEHGTSKTTPHDAPLAIAKGWEYYKNLTEHDFTPHIDFEKVFSFFEWSYNEPITDVYFVGIKK